MPQPTTLGRSRLQAALGLKEPITSAWTRGEVDGYLRKLIDENPEQYREISKAMMDEARDAVYTSGSTLSLDDLRPVIDVKAKVDEMKKQLLATTNLPADEQKATRERVMVDTQKAIMNDTLAAATANNNMLAEQVNAKARGNKAQLTAILSTPGIYENSEGEIIPMFVENSYSHGLTPREYYAGTFGARKSVVSTKFATRDAGYLGKQITAAIRPLQVTAEDCGAEGVGMPVDTDDEDNIGAVLAQKIGPYGPGDVITPEVWSDLKKVNRGKELLVRSPITCRAKQGVCSRCAGIRESGSFPKVGERVGVNASNAVAERIAQASLNCLVRGTRVRMADGTVKPIEYIQVGEYVLGCDKAGRTFPVAVTAVWDQGSQPAQRYEYRIGSTREKIHVGCTAIHGILQCTNYSRAREEQYNHVPRKLPAGRGPGRPSAILPIDGDTACSADHVRFATFLGYYAGDGIRWDPTKPDGDTLKISCACVQTAQDLAVDGIELRKLQASHDWSVRTECDEATTRANGTFAPGVRSHVKQAIQRCGWAGKYCHEKTLPAELWQWPREDLCAFIAGFVAADGSVYRNKARAPGIAFASTSRRMLAQFRELLAVRLQIYATKITETGKVKPGGIHKHSGWQFTITERNQVSRFATLVAPRIPGRKGSRLLRYLKEAPPSRHTVCAYRKAKRVSVTDLGIQPCHDITVDHPDALFVLENGIVVSNTKHSGGQGGQKGDQDFQGFSYIDQFMQVPEEFRDSAPLAETGGRIAKIEEAPHGGNYVYLNDEKHYVPKSLPLRVKEGDRVYPGDALSGGLINPKEVTRLKGIGEGRRYFTSRLTKMLRDSGLEVNRRNIEVISRGLVNHVVNESLHDEGQALPGDVFDYAGWASGYSPRKDAETLTPSSATGMYLEAPIMHYSIGTPVTPAVAKQMKKFGVSKVIAHKKPQGVSPHMLSLRKVPQMNPDWMGQMGSSYLKANVTRNAHLGAVSNTRGTDPLPRIAAGNIADPTSTKTEYSPNLTAAARKPGSGDYDEFFNKP